MTDICIVGAGPAGLVLALQLARAGVDITLLESSLSYKRSFRGESMQPDTVSIFKELGILDDLLEHGCLETHRMMLTERGKSLLTINYTKVPYRHKYVMDIPQPVLLSALLKRLETYANCKIIRGATCDELLWSDNTVSGVSYRLHDEKEPRVLRARVVVGADGRYSKIRDLGKIEWKKHQAARDVLWFKVPLPADAPENTARIMIDGANHLILLPTFPDYYRAGVNIPKGGFMALRREGIESFYQLVDGIDAGFGKHVREHVRNWNDIHLLDIFTTTAPQWGREGLLLIGDAAHTVTPLLGQGVNLAIQDAITLAPMLVSGLEKNSVDISLFKAFQAKRQADVDFVVNLQQRQEKLLGAHTPMQQFLRRVNYCALNQFTFIQRKINNRIAYRRQLQLQLFQEGG
ncbi:FAD-dependent monooxygenase [Rouxiella badensis]|jgi:2-polyprenyl-6-methoxyphenol hydroxylase-like FAD-dependent oxidoreductase|uniref:FAD-dependent monooxygenase n=1 Tax=Rouxiella badensis TaxID=1646377 RepID=UPI00037350BB|nr:FAD-dependent monooxygenase [Rouxiella badensis]MCC3704997.1 FAD-dependent monooxygenase [Rouxiella badensis]MCC3721455.1 FAD-dependent monooxygenase [Rouxiella badensis]MCC3731020.1 FAD-dependent monooxygenase [Rouxiella badensis]MCC3735237.1 FAD-dependent monooxygenase [Rouxiella badensis]MCC3742331.1 FAD-dependent monooxygenase [Rouxiella badensis]